MVRALVQIAPLTSLLQVLYMHGAARQAAFGMQALDAGYSIKLTASVPQAVHMGSYTSS